jgi:hypothetical protein
VALSVNLFFKVIVPVLFHIKLSRTIETIMGVGIPLVLLGVFEIYYRSRSQIDVGALVMEEHIRKVSLTGHVHQHDHQEAARQNRFGVSVIVIASAFVGLGIFGCVADMNFTVMTVGGIVLLLSVASLLKIRIGSSRVVKEKSASSVKSMV